MTTNFEIKPHKGVGHFLLQDEINRVLSIIKANGEKYKHADIVLGNQASDPLFIIINKEGIKLRFNGISQRLELIEIQFNRSQSSLSSLSLPSSSSSSPSSLPEIEYSFKGQLVFSRKNKEHIYYSNPNYSYINEKFGTSKIPNLIDNNKIILLPHEGISFLFTNISNSNTLSNDSIIDAPLAKIFIFEENNVSDSINKDNIKLQSPSPLIKYEVDKPDKGLSMQNFTHRIYNNEIGEFLWMQDTPIDLYLNDSLTTILHKMKNPNYVYDKSSSSSTTISDNNVVFEKDFFLNYYSLGMDILIDGNSKLNTAKKIILHCNNPLESKFGIYSRSNFCIELNKHNLKANIELNTSNSYRKISEEDVTEKSDNSNSFQIDTDAFPPTYSIEKCQSFFYANNNEEDEEIKNEKKKVSNKKSKEKRNKERKQSTDIEAKSNSSSIDKSNTSILLNTSDQYHNIVVLPWTNFAEVISKVPTGSYSIYQRHDTKINVVYKYYLFEGIIFEVLDNNNTIVSVVIYKKEQ